MLRVELDDLEGNRRYAEYDSFKVGNEASKYKLVSLGKYSGDAGQTVRSKIKIIVYIS